tara:strand:+ start:651 stop:824 length:174 start_codon:yes stop_codon:yes gene_type:complete
LANSCTLNFAARLVGPALAVSGINLTCAWALTRWRQWFDFSVKVKDSYFKKELICNQ